MKIASTDKVVWDVMKHAPMDDDEFQKKLVERANFLLGEDEQFVEQSAYSLQSFGIYLACTMYTAGCPNVRRAQP